MTKTFTVIIGHNETKFILHTELATRSSKFFEAAMIRDWAESREKEVTLAEFDEHEFGSYLQWLNTSEVTIKGEAPIWESTKHYLLGDFLGDSAFQGAVLNHVADVVCHANQIPGQSTIRLAWKRTLQDSPIRKLFLEIWALESVARQVKSFKDPNKDFPKDFIVELYQHTILQDFDGRGLFGEERKRTIKNCARKIAKEEIDGDGR